MSARAYTRRLVAAVAILSTSARARAQTGGFVATLGADTVHVEQFRRTGNVIRGTIVTRTPTTRVVRYTYTLDGVRLARYDVTTTDGAGNPLGIQGSAGSMAFAGDTIVRASLRAGRMDTSRIAAPFGAVPAPSIPYVGVSYLSYELGFAALRARVGDSLLYQLTMLPGQTAPSRTRAWLVGADSAELSYFGVARSGYRFDDAGRLLRADWTGTTYRYRVRRTDSIDVDAIARRWSEADARGQGMGPMSPRDTTRARVGAIDITVDYSRPARRGRVVWGEVVPWDAVWRLGADAATQLTTSAALRVGDVELPAGTYTLWMLPSQKGESKLIINTQTKIFGTQYNPKFDLYRVSLTRDEVVASTERLTITVVDGALRIVWGDLSWSVRVAPA
jgi:hypothetical protein